MRFVWWCAIGAALSVVVGFLLGKLGAPFPVRLCGGFIAGVVVGFIGERGQE